MNTTNLPLDLAAEGLTEGWTKERVIAAICARVRRDRGYLEYRKRTGRHTSYDELTQHDLYALALAACWLVEDTSPQLEPGVRCD